MGVKKYRYIGIFVGGGGIIEYIYKDLEYRDIGL